MWWLLMQILRASGVGHNNLKMFILWLWYGTAVGSSFILFFGFRIYDIYQHVRPLLSSRCSSNKPPSHDCFSFTQRDEYETNDLWATGSLIGLNLWLGFLLTANLCGMGFNMTYLALTNTTTVERIFSPNKYRPPRRAKGERWKVPARQALLHTSRSSSSSSSSSQSQSSQLATLVRAATTHVRPGAVEEHQAGVGRLYPLVAAPHGTGDRRLPHPGQPQVERGADQRGSAGRSAHASNTQQRPTSRPHL